LQWHAAACLFEKVAGNLFPPQSRFNKETVVKLPLPVAGFLFEPATGDRERAKILECGIRIAE